MKTEARRTFLLLVCGMIHLSAIAQNREWPGIRDSLYSETLKENRRIQVVLPGEYKTNPGEKFEVLYVLDGEWYMEQIPFIYNFASSSGYAPRNIFVLIPNTYVNNINLRDRDFSPTKTGNDPTLGGADNFHSFLKNELIPYIEKNYRTNGHRSLVGSSFSGLFAVYAFVKEPALFQSYVASDPNLNWDNNYVSKLAAKKLQGFSAVNSTLFIAGLTTSFAGMGIASMDSTLRSHAPPSIRWQCIAYANETHYSVQHKAFYDGFRFSHLGYTKEAPEYHPMNGIVEAGKPLKVFVLKENGALRYTTDGTEPTVNSPVLSRGEQIAISGPSLLKVKAFSNRPQYSYSSLGNFTAGEIRPMEKRSKALKPGLKYSLYEGEWETKPAEKTIKPVKSGILYDTFNINQLRGEKNSFYVIDGTINVIEEAYYVFYALSDNGCKVTLGDRVLFDSDGLESDAQSFVVPLKKGVYPMRLEFFQKKGSPDIHFFIRFTKGGNDRWWENQFFPAMESR